MVARECRGFSSYVINFQREKLGKQYLSFEYSDLLTGNSQTHIRPIREILVGEVGEYEFYKVAFWTQATVRQRFLAVRLRLGPVSFRN